MTRLAAVAAVLVGVAMAGMVEGAVEEVKTFTGRVVDRGGAGIEDAQMTVVAVGEEGRMGYLLFPTNRLEKRRSAKTDEKGDFRLKVMEKAYSVVVLSEKGYALTSPEELEQGKEVVLRPWARIEGEVKVGKKGLAGAEVQVNYVFPAELKRKYPALERIMFDSGTKADGDGKFVIERALAEKLVLVRAGTDASTFAVHVTPREGETVRVQVGGVGRPVAGQLQVPAGVGKWDLQMSRVLVETHLERMTPPYPEGFAKMTLEEKKTWYAAWTVSAEGKAFHDKARAEMERRRAYYGKIDQEGRFRVDDVTAGTYDVHAFLRQEGVTGDVLATGEATLTMPPVEGGVSEEVLDLGKVEMRARTFVGVGQAAPGIVAKTVEGKEWKLSDCRGKVVVLDFWATWCGPCVADLPRLKEMWKAHAKEEGFVMVSLSLDEEAKTAADFAKEKGMGWTQVFLGNWEKDPVTKVYGVEGIPSVWLIGADGKVMGKNGWGEETLKKALRELK